MGEGVFGVVGDLVGVGEPGGWIDVQFGVGVQACSIQRILTLRTPLTPDLAASALLAASTRSRDPNRGRVGVGGTPLRFRSPPRTASAASLSTIVEWGVRLRPSRRGHLAG